MTIVPTLQVAIRGREKQRDDGILGGGLSLPEDRLRVQEAAEQLGELGLQVLAQVHLHHTGNHLRLFLYGVRE